MKIIFQNGMTAVSLMQQESKLKLLLALCKNNSSLSQKEKQVNIKKIFDYQKK